MLPTPSTVIVRDDDWIDSEMTQKRKNTINATIDLCLIRNSTYLPQFPH